MKRAIGCVVFLLLSGYTFAQHRVATDNFLEAFNAKKCTVGQTLQPGFYMVQLDPTFKDADLTGNQIQIVRRLNDHYSIVKNITENALRKVATVKSIFVANTNWKLSESLLRKTDFENAQCAVQTTNLSSLKSFLNSERIDFREIRRDVLIIWANAEVVRKLSARDEVIYIGDESLTPAVESRVLELNLNPNHINQIHAYHPTITGEGMTISIKELPFDHADIDLHGRAQSILVPEEEGDKHATDIATIAAGAGNSFITGKGPAWEANIVSSDYSQLQPDADEKFVTSDAWVQNHSYGTSTENFYGVLARAYDLSTNSLPNLLHVFSSGNDGMLAPTTGTYQGIQSVANLTGNFKMSKNTLSIGAVDTTRNAIAFSSRGPAYDGRVKPELVAFSVQGTSNSAALVSGSVVLLQQAYKEKFGTIPPSALVKSLLISSAEDAGAAGLDYVTGYGNLDAYRALQLLLAEKFIAGSIGHNQIKQYDLNIPAGATQLKITIVWNDPAANANSSKALVNDIDLSLLTNAGTFLPWILNPAPSPTILTQQATRGRDGLNNIEQITLDNLSAGVYTIEVKGFDIPQGPQEFYISYDWSISNSFEWQFPTERDNFPYNGETGTYFYWNSTRNESQGRLEYSTDDGATWNVIATDVNLQTGYYRWNDPPPLNSTAKARMVVGGENFLTDAFTISYPSKISVAFNCSDSLMLRWERIPEAASYQVYALGEKFMEPIVSTSDTSIVFMKDENLSLYYTIEPILQDGRKALRSASVNYASFGVGCYLISFFPELVPEDGIYLNTVLGTTYGVSSIIIERETENGFAPIGNFVPGNDLVRFLDADPFQGFNRYRARIQFDNGEEIISEEVEEFFLTKKPFAVFPNPVSANGELKIFSKLFEEMNFTFKMYKSDGSLAAYMELNTDREYLPLEGIPAGLYIYHLTSEEGRFIGKLIIH